MQSFLRVPENEFQHLKVCGKRNEDKKVYKGLNNLFSGNIPLKLLDIPLSREHIKHNGF